MKWVRHQPHARMRKPASATVNYHGDVLFNVKAVKQVIKEAEYVEIFFDSNEEKIKLIGFRFFENPTSFSVILKFHNKKRNQAIAKINRKIVEEMGIIKHTAKRFSLEFDSESEVWFIDMEKGKSFSTENYKH